MDGLVVFIGAAALVLVACRLILLALCAAVQQVARNQPDPALPKLRHFVHRGCDFDRQKYLECQLKLAHRRLLEARQRHSELFALTHPQFKTPVLDPAPVSTPRANTVVLSDTFYRGQVRAALQRAQ